ncbi:MAG: recombinase family protein [Prevotella sp.]|nr:recombinase family protein [Prevotella sp.]
MSTALLVRAACEDVAKKQIEALNLYCEKHGIEVVGQPLVFREKSCDVRRVENFCMENEGRIDMVLCVDFNRISRSVVEIVEFCHTLYNKGVKVCSTAENGAIFSLANMLYRFGE